MTIQEYTAELMQAREAIAKLARECAEAYDRIAELENPWISVKDRMPEESDCYLVYIVANNTPKNKSIITLYYTNLTKQFVYENRELFTVTHWMPLPEPPKE